MRLSIFFVLYVCKSKLWIITLMANINQSMQYKSYILPKKETTVYDMYLMFRKNIIEFLIYKLISQPKYVLHIYR